MFPTIEILGSKIHFYPFFMGLAWGISINLVLYYNRKLDLGIKKINWLLLSQFLCAWVGAKLVFLISAPHEISGNLNFWLGGGFVFYGGLIAATLITALFILNKNLDWTDTNIFIPALAIGHSIGRLGCFFAGCCYGKVCELPWSIHLHGDFRHPTQLYEAIALAGLFLYFHYHMLKKPKNILWPYYFLMYGVIRFFIEMLRGDIIRGIYTAGISTSQIISVIIVFTSGLFLLVRSLKK